MDEKGSKDNKTMMALAALMFFSPFIHYLLKKGSLSFDDQGKKFIQGYVTLGYINLFLLMLAIISGIGNYFNTYQFFSVAYAISLGLMLLVLLIGTICVLSDVSLLIEKNFSITFYEVGEKKDLLLRFLPLYNVYLRYKLHNFGTPNRWIKESLLWRTFFVLFALGSHPLLLSVLIVLRLLRIATLMAGLDILHIQAKSSMSNLFTKNPEEIAGYVTGVFVFLAKGLGNIFKKASIPFSLESCVHQEKERYSRLYNLGTSWEIWIEYAIGIALIWTYRYFIRPDISARYVYLPSLLIVGRYIIMIVVRQHVPHIPLAREVRLLLSSPFRFLFHRSVDGQA